MTPFEESLILNLRIMNSLNEFSDFTIVSKDEQIIPCSKILLSARSKYYQALFRQEPSQTTSNLDFDGDVLRFVLSSLVTANFADCSSDQLLELLEVADFLQMPEMLSEIESMFLTHLSMENIYQVMDGTKIFISSLKRLQSKINKLIKENILFFDLDAVPLDWLSSVSTAPFANVRGKNGRFLDVVESELIVAMTLLDYMPYKEWNFSPKSKKNIAHGLLKIASRIDQTKSGIEPEKKERADNYENFHTLIHGNGEKLGELMGKYCTTIGGMPALIYLDLPFPHTKVKSNSPRKAYGTAEDRRNRNGQSWEMTGFFRKIYVKEGIRDGRQVIRCIHFLNDEGELLLPPAMANIIPELAVDTQEDKLNWLERNTTVLTVPEGQHIKDVILRSGLYIDQIGFVTNTGEILGPVGGTEGAQIDVYREDVCRDPRSVLGGEDWERLFIKDCKQHYLCGVDGMIYEEEGTQLIAQLRFSFAYISSSQEVVIEPSSESSDDEMIPVVIQGQLHDQLIQFIPN